MTTHSDVLSLGDIRDAHLDNYVSFSFMSHNFPVCYSSKITNYKNEIIGISCRYKNQESLFYSSEFC